MEILLMTFIDLIYCMEANGAGDLTLIHWSHHLFTHYLTPFSFAASAKLHALESHCEGISDPSLRSSVVDEERMMPHLWLRLLLMSFLECFDAVISVTGKISSL